MAKKSIDVETLKKNKFWIGLGAFGLVWLIALVVVFFSGDTKAKADWEAAEKGVKGAQSSRPKTPAYQKPWNEYGEKYRNHKDTIWKQAWDAQAPMYTWPEKMEVQPQYPEDLLGKDTNEDTNNRGRFRDQYKAQFTGLASLVAPAELEGGIDRIVPPQEWNKGRAPSREEIWLVQEDFWVRRELLSMIRDAMNTVAYFQEVKEKEETKLPEGIVARRVLRNANWELDLQFEKSKTNNRLVVSEKSTIKNVNSAGRTQALANPRTNDGLGFRLWQDASKFDLLVSGEPLAPGQTAPIKVKNPDVQPVNPTKAFGVVQLLEWEMSPVRRVDEIRLAYHSHRTFVAGLKIREDLKKLDPDPDEKEGAGAGAAGGTAGGMSTPMSGPAMSGGKGGMPGAPGGEGGGIGGVGGAGSGDSTKTNKIDRSRYMHVKEQARHLPIAMKLIVEQSHIHDLLTAVANSRLRIQITQVSAQHVRNIRRATPGKGDSAGGGAAGGSDVPGFLGGYTPKGPAGFAGMTPGFGSGRPSSPGMPSTPGMPFSPGMPASSGPSSGEGSGTDRPPPGQASDSVSVVQDTARLVELTIYGLATLYERFPARKKDPAAPATTTPTTPTTPGQ